MKHPQEVEVWYIIPAIRRDLASFMQGMGLKNKDVAGMLGVSAAAVSQYSKSKRGCEVEFPDVVKKRIKQAAERIKENPDRLLKEISDICDLIKEEGVLCKVHRKLCRDLEECSICIQKK